MDTYTRPILAFYNAEQNKKLIYHVVMGINVFVLTLFHSLISIFATRDSLVAFYITLIISMPVIYGLCHFLSICGQAALKPISSDITYSVASEHDLRTDL